MTAPTPEEVAGIADVLRQVPEDLIIGLRDSQDVFKPTHTQVNIGETAHKAADLIERLRAAIAGRAEPASGEPAGAVPGAGEPR
jgi:hypothetical protein